MPTDELQKGLKRLTLDLATGRWDEKYNYLRKKESYDAGYRFLVC
jgi:hypothetical protein